MTPSAQEPPRARCTAGARYNTGGGGDGALGYCAHCCRRAARAAREAALTTDCLPLRCWDVPPKGSTDTQVEADDTLRAITKVYHRHVALLTPRPNAVHVMGEDVHREGWDGGGWRRWFRGGVEQGQEQGQGHGRVGPMKRPSLRPRP